MSLRNSVRDRFKSPAKVRLSQILLAVVLTVLISQASAQTDGTAYASFSPSFVTMPRGLVWVPGALGGHLWISTSNVDLPGSFCRLDPPFPNGQLTNCRSDLLNGDPGQAIIQTLSDGITVIYVAADNRAGLDLEFLRYQLNPADETITNPTGFVYFVPSLGSSSGIAATPSGDLLLATAFGTIIRVTPPPTIAATTSLVLTGAPVAQSSGGARVNALALLNGDLYLAETGGSGVSKIAGIDACTEAAPCTAVPLNPQITLSPGGLDQDGTFLYVADAPATSPGTIYRHNPATALTQAFSVNVPAYTSTFDGVTRNQYASPLALHMDPAGNLFVGDDPSAQRGLSPPPSNQGHVWKISVTDTTPPRITINSPLNNGTYLLNQPVASSYTCTDDSGVAPTCVGPVPSGSNFDSASVGAKTFTVTSTDSANNTSTASVIYTVGYAAGGVCFGDVGHQILQPINGDGTSIFKQGSTVPVKFRVCDANGVSIGTAGVVTSFQLVQIISGTESNTVNETALSTSADTAFRFDTIAQQWIFNLSTKPLTAGKTYIYRITLNDGSFINFQFGLK